jgi:phosphatidylserine synthase 2
MVMGLMSLYLLFLTYMMFLPLNDGRKVMGFFDPKLGQPLPEKNYGDECDFYTPGHPNGDFANFFDAVFDIHFIAHLAGWWFKYLIIRDHWACWIMSIGFEIIEITFRHWLPNFYECWWDHLLLDLFGCNWLGIVLGAYTCRLLNVWDLNWMIGINKEEVQSWGFLSNPKSFFTVLGVSFFILGVDSMNFFLKYIIWIPADHNLLVFRVAVWGFTGIVAVKEYYEYCTNKYCFRLGPHCWLALFVLSLEISCAIKFGRNIFDKPFPYLVKLLWMGITAMFFTGLFISIQNGKKAKKSKFDPSNPAIDITKHD